MRSFSWIYPVFGMVMAVLVTYFAIARKESFYGMSPGTMDQLASTRAPTGCQGCPLSRF